MFAPKLLDYVPVLFSQFVMGFKKYRGPIAARARACPGHSPKAISLLLGRRQRARIFDPVRRISAMMDSFVAVICSGIALRFDNLAGAIAVCSESCLVELVRAEFQPGLQQK
jgi:hypothetical protein